MEECPWSLEGEKPGFKGNLYHQLALLLYYMWYLNFFKPCFFICKMRSILPSYSGLNICKRYCLIES